MFARVILDGCSGNKAEVIESATADRGRGTGGRVTVAKRNDLPAGGKKTRCGPAASGKALPSFWIAAITLHLVWFIMAGGWRSPGMSMDAYGRCGE